MHPLAILPLLAWAAPALSWSYSIDTYPTQCAPLSINITDPGVAPMEFTFYKLSGIDTPFSSWVNGSVWNVTIPESDPAGEVADFILPWSAGSPLVVVGSDATGFASGGTSPLYTVAESSSNDTGCLVPQPPNSSYLSVVPSWSSPVSQCGLMSAVFYGLSLPVVIDVLVPGGDSFAISTGNLAYPSNATAPDGWSVVETWGMNLSEGTNVAFQVSDANGAVFTSALVPVGAGNDTCLPGYVAPSSGSSGSSGGSSSSKAGAIAGGVLGGLLLLLLAGGVTLFLIRRSNRKKLLERRQSRTIGLRAYAATRPERLRRDSWPEGGYRDDPEEDEMVGEGGAGVEGKGEWAGMDRRMTTVEPQD